LKVYARDVPGEKMSGEKDKVKQPQDEKKIILVGNANVGKSVIFNLLTGSYAIVSNYPGTTVEISQGKAKIGNENYVVIDTPGIIDFLGKTEDQQVTREILLENPDAIVVLVIDAKNLKRGLVLSFTLCELGVRHVVVLNMMDEANDRGIFIDWKKLSEILGVPVVPMIATEYVGLHQLKESITRAGKGKYKIVYHDDVENMIANIKKNLPDTSFHSRGIASLLAGATDSIHDICKKFPHVNEKLIESIWERFQSSMSQPLNYLIVTSQIKESEKIIDMVATKSKPRGGKFQQFMSRVTIHPISGVLIALLVLFFMYLIVGKFGAVVLVDLIEGKLFGRIINPFFQFIFERTPQLVKDFFVGEFGIITMALTYGIGIVLPITGTFFLFFGFLEDCGYLPRLAFLMDRIFKSIGLTGKAVLPLVLGFGCGTMATLTTRILDTRKEKIITTVLLAVAIPCSAQLGVVLGVLGSISPFALLAWMVTIVIVMIIVGSALNLLVPGNAIFSMEIPPLRVPGIRNIVLKTGRRILWYLKEALPFFVLGTMILFLLDRAGVLSYFVSWISYPVIAMGLPLETSKVFVMGFLRRDYGAAGMFDLFSKGILNPQQAVVSAVTLTLFVPCIAQFFVMIKERGLFAAILISIFAMVIAFVVGFLLSAVLSASGLF